MPLTRHCERSGISFEISDRELDYCQRNGLPSPAYAPIERWREMLLFRNRRTLYRDTCALTGKQIITSFPPTAGYTLADTGAWESDQWDATQWGREYDFTRGFFEQYFELVHSVPVPALAGAAATCENAAYVNGVSQSKNCYLVFGGHEAEGCLYSQNVYQSRDLIDCSLGSECELCYGCRNIRNCYNLIFSEHCVSCRDSAFLMQCQNCSDCYGCANLSHKQHCIWNQQLKPEQYRQARAAIDLGSHASLETERERFGLFLQQFPLRSYIGVRNEQSTGNFLYDTQNCIDCMSCRHSQDLEHCLGISFSNDNFCHLYFGTRTSLIYNSINCGIDLQDLKYCVDIRMNCHGLTYCYFCTYGVSQCFGCIGLKRKSYCILNRQYSKEAYRDLTQRIVAQMTKNGEWGRFFPSIYAPHSYNGCEAIDVLPLSEAEALRRGYTWETDSAERNETLAEPGTVHIDDADDSILKQIFRCEKTAKPFRVIPEELKFLRQQRLALPVTSPTERLRERASILLYRDLGTGTCASCHKEFVTPYSTEQREVLCENCFLEVQYA